MNSKLRVFFRLPGAADFARSYQQTGDETAVLAMLDWVSEYYPGYQEIVDQMQLQLRRE